jgi:hypothetical protein
MLQIMIIAACATSVSVMVWRPYINVVLDSNPTRITLQLEATAGKYNALLRYLQVRGGLNHHTVIHTILEHLAVACSDEAFLFINLAQYVRVCMFLVLRVMMT